MGRRFTAESVWRAAASLKPAAANRVAVGSAAAAIGSYRTSDSYDSVGWCTYNGLCCGRAGLWICRSASSAAVLATILAACPTTMVLLVME